MQNKICIHTRQIICTADNSDHAENSVAYLRIVRRDDGNIRRSHAGGDQPTHVRGGHARLALVALRHGVRLKMMARTVAISIAVAMTIAAIVGSVLGLKQIASGRVDKHKGRARVGRRAHACRLVGFFRFFRRQRSRFFRRQSIFVSCRC